MADIVSIVISSISLIISAIIAYRTLWKDRPQLNIFSDTGAMVCKYPSDKIARNHFVAFSEIANVGYVSVSIAQMGLIAVERKRFKRKRIIEYSVLPCLYEKEGELFTSKTLLPGELFNVWIHPKRVEGYELLISQKHSDKQFNFGVYAITANGNKFISFFSEESLSACRIIVLPDENIEQPKFHIPNYPPTSYELKAPTLDQLGTLNAIEMKASKDKKIKAGKRETGSHKKKTG